MNNKKELQKEVVVRYEIEGQEIKLTPRIVQDYLVGTNAKITMPEFKMFTELCKVRGLNPFLREAYLIKYSQNQPAQIVVGKDAIVKRAVLNKNFNGMKSGIIVTTENGEEKKRVGTFKLANETLVGGWAEVFRKDWTNSIEASVSLEETIKKSNPSWQNQPATMIEKVAKVRALREAFVEDLGGMYEAEEMNVELPEVSPEDKIIQQDDEEVVDAEIEENTEVQQVDINDI